MTDRLNSIPELNVSGMVKLLSDSFSKLIEKHMSFICFPSVMLWGAPGVGKSQGVREVAKKIEFRTGKKVVVTDVRLQLYNPVDLRGIPTADDERKLAVWLKPDVFQMDESESVVNILFLDEITAAPQTVQAAAYQITLDRKIGEHTLPSNCIVIAAGNRITDRSVAYNMPKALANRLCHLEIVNDAASWHDWAVIRGLHKYVTGYLEYNPQSLMQTESAGEELAFTTPRSWEMASNILTRISVDFSIVYPLIAGCVGTATADRLKSWSRLYRDEWDINAIFRGEEAEKPKTEEQRIALRTAMIEYARQKPDQRELTNSINYACLLPWSFRGKLLYDYSLIPSIRKQIEDNNVYRAAVQKGYV